MIGFYTLNFLQQHLIYQDDDFIAIHKPAGILTIPGKEIADSVLTRLQAINANILLIHRLDRDTSGILVFALNKATQSHISKQFQNRETEKQYVALVSGHITGQGCIDIPVVYDASRPPLHKVDEHEKKPAITYWQAMKQFYIHDLPVTRMQLKPITGRSHQLRVHCQYLGHAIVGDTLYADEHYQHIVSDLCLHAEYLTFTHPKNQSRVELKCPAPF